MTGSLVTFSRIVRKPFTLSNGLAFPTKTHLIVPACMISLDSEIYDFPEDFNGFRFSDLRAEKPENVHKYQFTGTSPEAMHFGYGRNACPGRFFAGTTIKVFVAYLLTHYDIKLSKERPKNDATGSQNSPPQDAEILFRFRQ